MKKCYLTAFAFVIITSSLHAQDKFMGVWQQSNTAYAVIPGVDWGKFNTEYVRLSNEGLRLNDLETYIKNGQRYYMSSWIAGTGKHAFLPGLEWVAFNNEWNRLNREGLRLVDLEIYSEGGKRYYLSVWREGNYKHALIPPKEWTEFSNEWQRLSNEGYRLADVETYSDGGKRYYVGVWHGGTGAHALLPPQEWAGFESEWKRLTNEGQRLDDVEMYTENGKTYYVSSWRAGLGNHTLWNGADWEGFTSHLAIDAQAGLRLKDIETYGSSCPDSCFNKVLNSVRDKNDGKIKSVYDYKINGSRLHCSGIPGSCPEGLMSPVVYRWPSVIINDNYHVRFSAVNIKDQIFTLPFKVPSAEMNGLYGWMYGPDSWHLALDYSTGNPLKTFEVVAAAKGKVIHMGWDDWSGNTIVISHDVGTRRDVYRTIYMHLRNGPANDCALSWSRGVPASGHKKSSYKVYLDNCGCKEDPEKRTSLPTDKWGTDSQKFDMNLLGKTVEAGDVIGWAGSTGPGGFAGTHLHIFFAHRDPVDNRWYFFDPYGIYAYNACYPEKVNGVANSHCPRYPVAWKGGRPQYAR